MLILCLILSGCASTPAIKTSTDLKKDRVIEAKRADTASISKPGSYTQRQGEKKAGIYHRVKKGQTLRGISRNYGVDINAIIEANKLDSRGRIKAGQLLLIPGCVTAAGISKEDFVWPVEGKVIVPFGENKGSSSSKGIDIQARENSVIVAARSGKVIFSEEKLKGYGKTVILDHGNEYQTVYAHNSEILVKIGQEVRQSDPVAKVGRTGRSDVPYLHFEIRQGHKPQDPLGYLPKM